MNQGFRFKKMTTKWSKTSPLVAAATSAQAFKVNPQITLLFCQFHPIFTLLFQGASATTGTSSVTLFHTKHFILQIPTIFLHSFI
jgi:hypothetical protein